MKELTIVNGKEVKVIDSREVAEMLEVKHYKILEKLEGTKDGKTKGIIPVLESGGLHSANYFIESSYKDASGKSNKCYICTVQGAKAILDNTRNYKQKETLYNWYYEHIEQEVAPILVDRQEVEFIDMLEQTLEPFNIQGIRQYQVNSLGSKYRIDFYIPSLNIAIEYDENGHEHYSYEKHEGRQKEIENKLGCRFIRVTDSNSHSFNVGQVIKEIFNI